MIILILVTILLDFLISYFIPSYFNSLNLFYPMLTLTLVVFLYNKIDFKNYFKVVFLMGLLYDLIFSYIFLFNALVFLMFAKIVKKVDKYIRCNLFVSLILVVIFIFLYDLILFFLVKISNYSLVTFSDLVYKFKNSLILNILYFLFLSFWLKNKDFKDKKVLKYKMNLKKAI